MGLFDRIAALARRGEAAPPTAVATSIAPPKEAERLLADGQALEAEGRPKEALARFDAAIASAPAWSRAHMNRGNALLALGDIEAARAAYEAAVRLDPGSAPAHYNLGNALAAGGRHDEAFAAWRHALALDARFVDAEAAQGVHHAELGQAVEAEAAYRRALALRPDQAPVLGNLAQLLQGLGRLDEAVAAFRRALDLDDSLTALHFGLGNALLALGRHEAALASYDEVLRHHPQLAAAHGLRGQALLALGRQREAVASLRRAAAAAPGLAHAQQALGTALVALGEFDEAATALQRAAELDPRVLDTWLHLGVALGELGRLQQAVDCWRRVLELDAGNVIAHNNLGGIWRRLGRMDEAASCYEQALAIDPGLLAARSNLLFIRQSQAMRPSEALLVEARAFGEAAARAARPFTTWLGTPDPDRPLRIGLVSGDLRSHPVGYFLVGALQALVSQAAGRIELHAYANQTAFDEVSAKIRAACRGWHAVAALDDEALARRVHGDRIDVLIDLAGHTGGTRLQAFAWKPAPVQVTWLGYLGTTGLAAIDHLIADERALPPEEDAYFSEHVWRLPGSYLCFTPPAEAGEVGPLPALASGRVTFASFNNLAKMTDDVVALWSRVLQAVPGSQLLLKAQQLQEAPQRDEVAARFARHGIERMRLQLEGLVARAAYLEPFGRVDIALDPFPYPGITTTVENLWMGVPVLTLAGHTFMARQGAALLGHAGLPEWIATDADHFVALAVRHAADLPALQALRQQLRAQVRASPLFDATLFAARFEQALRGMWREWCMRR